ncbi:MAG: cysteine desulfurase [Candidatus Aenigmatarchaeota archaeon]|nr:cysteine desulfurase [Nanoarchaeota archaeon]
MDVNKIREDFPILKRKLNNKQLVYFDNAATSQRPRAVIDAVTEYYENHNANIHRGIHTLSEEGTEMYENARENIHNFVNAGKRYQTVFTHGTTEALNSIAYAWGLENLKEGDEIVLTIMEHHSNIVPWQFLMKKGVKIKYVDIDDNGELKMDQFKELVSKKTKIISVAHVSNVLGTINNVKEIGKIAKDAGALFVVDGAQAAPHIPVNIKDTGADFYTFSGHKMLGPTGIGVLIGRKEILEKMEPFMFGGSMIHEVHTTGSTWAESPEKFEAGTPNIAGAIGFNVAVDYLKRIGMDNVLKHEKELLKHAMEKISMPKLTIYGPKEVERRSGVISFNYSGMSAHDLATILDNNGIAIRSGHHCAQPLMERLKVPSTGRASFYIYNTIQEVDMLASSLQEAGKVFG